MKIFCFSSFPSPQNNSFPLLLQSHLLSDEPLRSPKGPESYGGSFGNSTHLSVGIRSCYYKNHPTGLTTCGASRYNLL